MADHNFKRCQMNTSKVSNHPRFEEKLVDIEGPTIKTRIAFSRANRPWLNCRAWP